MRIRWIQHVPFEGLGLIEGCLLERGFRPVCHRVYAGDSLPTVSEVDFLIVMGGPMSVNDEKEHPWLVDEKELVGQVVRSGKPVWGICLGAQMIASSLGASVFRANEREIGWFPIRGTARGEREICLANELTVFHWHGETFDLPDGAICLASSPVCENQAFQWGDRAIGTQFHLEATEDSVGRLIENCSDELEGRSRFVQTPEEMLAATSAQIGRCRNQMESLLDHLLR